MDAAHWPQGLGLVKPMEEMLMGAPSANQVQGSNPNAPAQAPSSAPGAAGAMRGAPPAMAVAVSGVGAGSTERRPRPQKEKAINCPRCNSTNTKFCYYNNYDLLFLREPPPTGTLRRVPPLVQ